MIDYARVLEGHLVEQMAADEVARQQRMREAWKAYHGDMDKPLKVAPGQPNDNVIVAKARTIVDASVAMLFGSGVTFNVGEEGDDSPEDEYLKDVWKANKQPTWLAKLATNGGVCGHLFVKIVQPRPPRQPLPRLLVLDPANVRVRYEDDDIDQVYEYINTWNSIDDRGRAVIHRQRTILQDNDLWLIVDEEARPGEYVQLWRETGRQVWPYVWAPMLDCQNLPLPNVYYGEPDLTPDVVALIGSLNFTLSNWARIIKWYANPRQYITGVSSTTPLDVAADKTLMLPTGATLGLLQINSDLAGTAEFARRLEEAVHELTATPAIATGKLESVGALSGVALQVLYAPLTAKTEKKRGLYGDLLEELCRRVLDLGGFGYENDVDVTWPETTPQDAKAEAETLKIHKELGVSTDTILEKLGYDVAAEQENKQAETDAEAVLGDRMLAAFERGQNAMRQGATNGQEATTGQPGQMDAGDGGRLGAS